VGNSLVVASGMTKQTFSDLDELIVNYVKAMARKTEELMSHEKFRAGSEDELRKLFFYKYYFFLFLCLGRCVS